MKTHQLPYLPFRRARKREKVNSTTRNANSEVDPFRVSMRSSADEINNVPWERLAVRLIGCQKERERDGLDGTPLLLLRRRHFSPLAFSFPYVRRAARTRTLFSKIVLLMKPDRRRDFTYVKLGLGKRNTGRSCRIRGRLTLVRLVRTLGLFFILNFDRLQKSRNIYTIVLWYYWMPMRNPAPTTNCYFILRNEEINLPRSRCCSKFSGILIIVT